ncbi:hypothetical protein CHS0354_016892 [Potamilus streckersoni]|uniref:Multifunctional methyltransferase subunit TRM112-like protein n=1 Tax=Potamilus streckersoni TaxID=2493646 RepID=A0AAE0S891_9BIVA|nr:hypothetical protein CHS0354_016892 [Potamilus streckersoni]
MKLITHNMLTSNIIKGVTKGYPLGIIPRKVEVKDVDYNPEFLARMIPNMDWSAVCKAAKDVGHDEGLPKEIAPNFTENDEFLKAAHHVLLEIDVVEGDLVCPETGRKFPVSNGVPNMLLKEEEA